MSVWSTPNAVLTANAQITTAIGTASVRLDTLETESPVQISMNATTNLVELALVQEMVIICERAIYIYYKMNYSYNLLGLRTENLIFFSPFFELSF